MYLCEKTKNFDDYGNFIDEAATEEFCCQCRCDDSDVRDAVSDNGERFFPSYHVVCEALVACGTNVRIYREDGSLRAEGKVRKTAQANYFGLFQLWI